MVTFTSGATAATPNSFPLDHVRDHQLAHHTRLIGVVILVVVVVVVVVVDVLSFVYQFTRTVHFTTKLLKIR